jgi:uncharacterized protein YbjT (DUF2867 family)
MVLLVGGTGRLGSRVGRRLLAEGRRVRVLARSPATAEDLARLGAEIVAGDLRDRGSLERAVRGVARVVVTAHDDRSRGHAGWARQAAGHHHLIEAARAERVEHLVFVSCRGVGPEHPLPAFRLKHAVEVRLRGSGLGHAIVRPTAFMEPWAAWIGRPILDGRVVTIPGLGDQPINLIALDDVAHYVLLALDHPEARDRTLEIGGPENLTLNQVADAFERYTDRPVRRRYVPLRLLRAAGACALPFAPGVGRALATAAHRCSSDQTFDAAPLLADFPRRLTRLADLARQGAAAPRPDGTAARRVNRAA